MKSLLFILVLLIFNTSAAYEISDKVLTDPKSGIPRVLSVDDILATPAMELIGYQAILTGFLVIHPNDRFAYLVDTMSNIVSVNYIERGIPIVISDSMRGKLESLNLCYVIIDAEFTRNGLSDINVMIDHVIDVRLGEYFSLGLSAEEKQNYTCFMKVVNEMTY